MDDEQHVRNPDPVITEQLIPTSFDIDSYEPTNHVSELDEYEIAIQASIDSYNNYLQNQEEELAKLIEMEAQARLGRFDKIKKHCIRMAAIDSQNRSIYEIFLNYISLYETDSIDCIFVDEDFYNKFFKLMTSSRLTKEDIDNCKQFIQI